MFSMNRLIVRCRYLCTRGQFGMLLMIAVIISAVSSAGSAVELAPRSDLKVVVAKSSYVKPQQPMQMKRNESLPMNSEDRTKLDGQISLDSNASFSDESIINLSLLDERVQNHINMNNQLKRHQYSLTNQTHLETNSTQPRVESTGQNLTTTTDLETSDSRYRPHVRSRSDEADEYESMNSGGDDLDSSSMDDENYIDGASSNRREKKVMRELTKILSKGMSGATDSMRVETLENLKKRQKERKAIQDDRAKLFEDLLTTAINNHSEKLKKSRRHPQHKDSSSSLKTSASNLDGPPSNTNIDPELTNDAETVLQHLQGLATAIDGHPSPTPFGPSTNVDPADSLGYGEPEDATSPAESSDLGESEAAADEKPAKIKLPIPSERPIVRQFKKIKNQISQRRKQLDQIKKLFNAELVLNPKDGSLTSKKVGTTSKKNRQHQAASAESDDLIDYSQDSDAPPSNKRTKSGGRVNGYKARELLNYLRENPEILASVMSELTVDADPTQNSRSLSPMSNREEAPYSPSGSPIDYSDLSVDNISNRKSVYQPVNRLYHAYSDTDQPAWHQAPYLPSASSRRLPSARHLQDFDSLSKPAKPWPRNLGNQASSSNYAQPLRARSSESLLLESLRERQLLNLARLDLVLAERQASSSNRSSILSQMASNQSQRIKPHNRSDLADPFQRSSRDDEQDVNKNNQSSGSFKGISLRPEEEVTHHFMVMNPNNSDTSSGRAGSEFLNQLQHNQLQDNQAYNARSLNMPASQNLNSNVQQHHAQSMNSNQIGPAGRVGPSQQPANTLKRFRDWRDVSQSEASSWQYDKTNNPVTNVTWAPYDLTPGGSTSLAMEAQSSRAPPSISMNYRPQVLATSRNELTLPPVNSPYMQLDPLNGPPAAGSTFPLNNLLPDIMNQQHVRADKNSANSIFMAHSSEAGEFDSSTVRLGGGQADGPIKASASSPAVKKQSNKHEDPESDEEAGGLLDPSEPPTGRSGPVNYFSAYKQEMSIKERKRPRPSKIVRKAGSQGSVRRQSPRRDEPDTDENSDTDDMGAMWA